MEKILLCMFLLFFSSASITLSLEMNQFPNITDPGVDAYRNYSSDITPEIKEVTIFPYAPKSEEPVTIKAIIFNNPEKTEVETISATLYYSVDEGKTYMELPMEQDENDIRIWKAVIPPQKAETEVKFYIQAVDAVGNIATEIPFINKVWPPEEKNLALTASDDDDKDQIVSDDMDIIKTYTGYDEEYLYIKMQLQGKISEGELQKPFLNAYGAGILNMDKGSDILAGYLLAYIPYFSKLINYPKCIFYDTGHISFSFEAGAEEIVDENILYMRVKRQVLGKDSERFKLLYGTAGIITRELLGSPPQAGAPPGLINFWEETIKRFRETPTFTLQDFEMLKRYLDFKDATNYSMLYLHNHSYTVKE